jgi:hypothetical protein
MLDICYLWVDSLCIIQDDKDDFYREPRLMASVYENSYLTIAATGARDGTDGLFLRSPQDHPHTISSSAALSRWQAE